MPTTVFTDGVTLSAAAWANDIDSTAYAVLTGVAGTNTITATGPANYAYAAARTPLYFTPAATNTGATTINITPSGGSTLGAKDIFSNGAACVGGELVISVPTQVIYDGTQFNIVGALYPRFFVGSFTRDTTVASGTQAVTGVGFQPKAVIFIAVVSGTARASIGVDIRTAQGGISDDHNTIADTWNVLSAYSIFLESGGGANYGGEISTLGADGFTVTWTKTGNPTGTATITYLALR